MDYSKQGNSSEASSDENEHNSPEKNNDAIGKSRSYECSFCKRGFTNAQALGGHMNIHRKDKAKVKSKQSSTKSASISMKNSFNEDDYMSSSRFLAPNYVANEQAHYHAHATFGAQMNYQQFHFDPVPKLNPSYRPHTFFHSSLISTIHDHVDDFGPNMSLEVGSSRMEDDNVNNNPRNDVIEGEVDLELRLGYDP